MSDLECESESDVTGRGGFGGKASATCSFNVDIAEIATGKITSHVFTKSTGYIGHNSFLASSICFLTIGLGCLPFQLSAEIDAARQAADMIEPLHDYYDAFSESKICDEKQFD